jgi:hypothetical protein
MKDTLSCQNNSQFQSSLSLETIVGACRISFLKSTTMTSEQGNGEYVQRKIEEKLIKTAFPQPLGRNRKHHTGLRAKIHNSREVEVLRYLATKVHEKVILFLYHN